MESALSEARIAALAGEVPVGAVLVSPSGEIVARAANQTRQLNDPTAHAEILVIREACRALKRERLNGFDLYVTLEPCPMCAAAISFARIERLYYGASDPKSGAIEQGARLFTHPQTHHKPEIYPGIAEAESACLLREFFQPKRA
ncbi:MAG: nucleoside deaminase [Alphaproteobacteria bacterium]|nr:nucleoside deaminase [Alphaproteobacteria bacterium]